MYFLGGYFCTQLFVTTIPMETETLKSRQSNERSTVMPTLMDITAPKQQVLRLGLIPLAKHGWPSSVV